MINCKLKGRLDICGSFTVTYIFLEQPDQLDLRDAHHEEFSKGAIKIATGG